MYTDKANHGAQIPSPRTNMRQLLERVVSFYLHSGDFNGLPIGARHDSEVDSRAAIGLLRRGLIEVMTGEDYLNPHIRPWPSKRPLDAQIESIRLAAGEGSLACLYPTGPALAVLADRQPFEGRPYELKMALGGTTLQPVFFRPDVVEPYREDPRFNFLMGDFGFDFNLSSESYVDLSEPDSERVSLLHGGLAYNVATKGSGPLKRAVCVLLCDLSGFTRSLQSRWNSYEIPDQTEYSMHPMWWRSQMGSFPDGSGPLTRFFGELRQLDRLNQEITGQPLFATTERPKEFSWMLRPSQREFDSFVHQLDKLLSDNLRHAAFDSLGVPAVDEDGNQIGTLNRFGLVLQKYGVSDEQKDRVLAPMRRVRKLRQKPAHKVQTNIQDHGLIEEQIELINEVAGAMHGLRMFWQSNPNVESAEIPSYLDDEDHYRF